MMKLIFFLLTTTVFAWSNGSGISYQGRLLGPDGNPITNSNVQFKIQIRTPGSENCLLYEEIQNKDLSNSDGIFAITINDGSGTRLDSSGYSIDKSFANLGTFSFPNGYCSVGTNYTANAADGRKLQLFFNDGTFPNGQWEPAQTMTVNFTPMAIESQQVGGYKPTNLLRVDTNTTAPEMTSTQLTDLMSLINGSSSKYIAKSSSASMVIPSYTTATPPSSATEGSIWFDSTSKQIKYNDGSATQTIGTGSGSPTGAAGGHLQGTYPNPQIASGVITNTHIAAGAAIVDSKLATISTAGKVSGSAINTGTIGGNTAISTSGNIQTSGNITTNLLYLYENSGAGPGYVALQSPASVTSSYVLRMPAALPVSSGYVLASDTSGNLSWISPSSSSVTNVTANAPLSSSGGSTPAISISQSSGSTSGYLSSTDWNTFNNKLNNSLTAGKIWIGSNGTNLPTAQTPSGDISMDNSGVFTVTKIQNTNVSSTTPTTAGQVLRFNGSNWLPNFVGMTDLRSNVTGTTALASSCGSNQTLTYNSAMDNLTCTTIAINGSQVSGNISGNATNITGTLAIANGGTGAATQAGAINALLPSQSSNSGKYLTTDGTNASWANVSSSQWTTSASNIYYNTGNVGIGTAAPSSLLTIKSVINTSTLDILGTTGTSIFSVEDNWDNGRLAVKDSTGLERVSLTSNSSNGAYITSNAKVTALQDGATASWGAGLIINVDNAAGNENGIAFGDGGVSIAPAAAISYYDPSSAGYSVGELRFKTSAATNGLTTRMTISKDGNVGIGTTSPSYPLHLVTNTSGNSSFGIQNSNASGWSGIDIYGNDGAKKAYWFWNNSSNGLPNISGLGTSANAPFIITTNNLERMRFDASGNVGIGTTSPSTKLDVTGALNISDTTGIAAMISEGATTGTNYGVYSATQGIGATTNIGGYFNATGATNNYGVRVANTLPSGATNWAFYSGSAAQSYIAGSMGIGASTPSYKLHVVGSSGATVGYFSDGTQSCSITPATAGNISCSSDERLKQDIQAFSDSSSLENILKLQTVTYEWKSVANGRHTGYIAQEVEKIAPEFVTTSQDGYKQVSYTGFIPWITGSIKELYKKIVHHDEKLAIQARQITSVAASEEALDTKIKSLEAENEKLKANDAVKTKELESLKARLEKIEKVLNSK